MSEKSFEDALKSSVFHHKQKGCKISYFGYPRKVEQIVEGKIILVVVWIPKAKCNTHQAMICYAQKMCYWEDYWHYGSSSKSLNKLPKNK